jgi:DNA-binding response OmpR family regulator
MSNDYDAAAASRAVVETVLAVEDNIEVLDFVRDVLEAAGYRVLTATTAAEAIALSEADPSPIHLLLTDLMLADLRGQELAARLRATRPGLRVLYISGYPSEMFTREGALALDAPLLMKPFLITELEQAVRELLGPSQ